MNRIKLTAIGALLVAALALAGCFQPIIPVVDPVAPVAPVEPVLTLPVAAFSFYPPEYPVQTHSEVLFDGSASYDPDDEIMWGSWSFDDGTPIIEGVWTNTEKKWENGEWVWKQVSVKREVAHRFDVVGTYTVTLTVRDYDGNQDSTTRTVRVR